MLLPSSNVAAAKRLSDHSGGWRVSFQSSLTKRSLGMYESGYLLLMKLLCELCQRDFEKREAGTRPTARVA